MIEHEIRCKINLGVALSEKEESYYILYMASLTERILYFQEKRRKVNEIARTTCKKKSN